jgi:hypothetical protein
LIAVLFTDLASSGAADATIMSFSNGWRRGSVRLGFAQRERKGSL